PAPGPRHPSAAHGPAECRAPCARSEYKVRRTPSGRPLPLHAPARHPRRLPPSPSSASYPSTLPKHRFHVGLRERLHVELGVQTVEPIRSGADQRIRELLAVVAHQSNDPLPFLGPLL